MDLSGRHVLVTGGSRGIGRAVGAACVAHGARVTLVARTEAALRDAARGTGASWLVADLADPADVATVLARAEEAAPVDVLVNNAGIDAVGPFTGLTADEHRRLWEVNVVATGELTRQALPGMLRRGSGRVVFVSSLSAEVALPGLVAYSATKAAVSQLAEGLRDELRGTGVGVTLVEVGSVRTDMWERVSGDPATAAAFDRVHRRRVLRQLDVAEVTAGVVRAVERDRGTVVLPRRGRTQWLFARAPQRASRLLLR